MRLLEEAELTAKIESELPVLIQSVDVAARPYLAAYQQMRKAYQHATILFVGGLVGFIVGANIGSVWLTVGGLVFCGVGTVRYIRIWRQKDLRKQANQFTVTVHTAITEAVYRLVGFLNPKLVSHAVTWDNRIMREARSNPALAKLTTTELATAGAESIRPLVDASELITEPANGFKYDDVVISTWQEKTVTVAELDVTHTTGSGKNRHTKQIFKGLFLHIGTSLTTTGKTFLSTDGDRDGFGHQSFWSNLTGAHGVKETTLEWNEFENAFHVATDNPIEARYIFTPDFMHVLYDFWQKDKSNIRMSVIGNNLYILCPTNNVKMYRSIKDLEPQTIRDEVFSLAKTLLLLMRLLQVVSTRTGR